ncbi:hypothetical protein WJX77_005546 [Trebouxia sp. C0004]
MIERLGPDDSRDARDMLAREFQSDMSALLTWFQGAAAYAERTMLPPPPKVKGTPSEAKATVRSLDVRVFAPALGHLALTHNGFAMFVCQGQTERQPQGQSIGEGKALVKVVQQESTPSSSGGHQQDSPSTAGMDARYFQLPHVDSAPEVPEVGGTGEARTTTGSSPQEEHVSGSKSKEGLEAGISQPLQGGAEPASRESSRSDASVVFASDMQAAPTPLQAEAVDASDKVQANLSRELHSRLGKRYDPISCL